jgi:hypothetical protein
VFLVGAPEYASSSVSTPLTRKRSCEPPTYMAVKPVATGSYAG